MLSIVNSSQFLPVEVPVNDHLQSLVCARLCILDLWEIPSVCLKGLRTIIYLNLSQYLHLLHKLAVAGFHQVCLQVEGTTNPRVGDHRSEDL